METYEKVRQSLIVIIMIIYYSLLVLPFYYAKQFFRLFVTIPPKSVRGEIVLITGTGHGMGRLLALKYAREGATVVGWDVNENENKKTFKEIEKLGYKGHGYKCDVSNRKEVFEVARQVQRDVGDVTILYNNAGIMPSRPFLEHTESDIARIMDINIMGHFWILQAFLPTMKQNNKGHIVALSSLAGLMGCDNLAPYCTSKYAVRGLMEALYEEYRRYPGNKIEFTTIYPYMVDTGLCKNWEVTLSYVTPMAKAEYVVEEIFEAQIHSKMNCIVPAYMRGYMYLYLKVLPQELINEIRDFIRADIKSDLEITSNSRLKIG